MLFTLTSELWIANYPIHNSKPKYWEILHQIQHQKHRLQKSINDKVKQSITSLQSDQKWPHLQSYGHRLNIRTCNSGKHNTRDKIFDASKGPALENEHSPPCLSTLRRQREPIKWGQETQPKYTAGKQLTWIRVLHIPVWISTPLSCHWQLLSQWAQHIFLLTSVARPQINIWQVKLQVTSHAECTLRLNLSL